jgi:hypothetical protein
MIQKVYRGHYQRKHYLKALIFKHKELLKDKFMRGATRIQSVWRGFNSRKTNFDFYSRKKALGNLQMKGEDLMIQREVRVHSQMKEMMVDIFFRKQKKTISRKQNTKLWKNNLSKKHRNYIICSVQQLNLEYSAIQGIN